MVANKLFFSIIKFNDLRTFWKLKDYYFDEKGQKIFYFIREFIGEYKALPRPETLVDEFNIDYIDTEETPDYLYEKVIKIYQKIIIEEAAKEAIRSKSIEPYQVAILKYHCNKDIESKNYSQTAKDRISRYDEIKGTGGINYLATGNSVLDEVFLGYHRTEYILIGGEEGLGKTWYLIRRALSVSKATSKNILFVSGEMGKEEIEERADSINAGYSYSKYIRGNLSEAEEEKRRKGLKLVAKKNKIKGTGNLIIKDDCFNLSDIESYIDIFQPAIVFIDGLHLFSKSLDWKDMMHTSMQTKILTRKHKIPFVCMMHLKESVEDPEDAGVGSFAYFKASRDPDIAMVMYQDDFMKLNRHIGFVIVKGRKEGKGTKILTEVNYNTQEEKIWTEE